MISHLTTWSFTWTWAIKAGIIMQIMQIQSEAEQGGEISHMSTHVPRNQPWVRKCACHICVQQNVGTCLTASWFVNLMLLLLFCFCSAFYFRATANMQTSKCQTPAAPQQTRHTALCFTACMISRRHVLRTKWTEFCLWWSKQFVCPETMQQLLWVVRSRCQQFGSERGNRETGWNSRFCSEHWYLH